MKHKISRLLKGKLVNLKGDEIIDIVHHTPNMSTENYKKLEKAFEKNKGCRIKLSESELQGCGLGQLAHEVKKDAQKVGKVAMKSGVVDVAIDETVNLAPIPAVAKKVTSNIIKHEAHKLTGTGSNPYLPPQLAGSGISPHHIQMSYLSNNIQGK